MNWPKVLKAIYQLFRKHTEDDTAKVKQAVRNPVGFDINVCAWLSH